MGGGGGAEGERENQNSAQMQRTHNLRDVANITQGLWHVGNRLRGNGGKEAEKEKNTCHHYTVPPMLEERQSISNQKAIQLQEKNEQDRHGKPVQYVLRTGNK